jgi:DNA-binding SARP family transcriptional activator
MEEQPLLKVRLLGDFRLAYCDQVLSRGSIARYEILLAYLLIHRDSPIPRQRLAFLFWPEANESQARSNFRVLIFRLRQNLPFIEQYLDLGGNELKWQQDMPIWLDIDAFKKELAYAKAQENLEKVSYLQAALELYKGDLLPDLYENWILSPREHLRQTYLRTLETLADVLEKKGEYPAARKTARCLLSEDPLLESSYLRLMRLQALTGNVAGALRTYHTCAAQLEQELGVEPGPEVQEAHRLLLKNRGFKEKNNSPTSPQRLTLIGRDDAWQALLSIWQATMTGKAQVVFLSGEAGIGKTRLAEELLTWARRQGIPTLTTNCFPQLEELPFAPLAEWLRSDRIQQLLPELALRWRKELTRVLPELLTANPDLEPPLPMTEAWQRQHLFMALTESISAIGEPLLLFLDDIQWADIHTLDWLLFFIRQNKDTRFMLLTTSRKGEETIHQNVISWKQKLTRIIHTHDIFLDRLDALETKKLAAQCLNKETEDGFEAIYQETEGNPLFIIEMVRAGLKDTKIPLPSKVRSVIDVRINQLSLGAQELAGLAAVIGRSFTFDLLAAASPLNEDDIVHNIDELWQRRIIREQGEAAYAFSHDKIREVALARLSHTKQQLWHRHVAQALLKIYASDISGVYNQIASHWENGGEAQKAAQYYVRAAKVAFNIYAYKEAIAHLERALNLISGDDLLRADIYSQEGAAYTVLGDHTNSIMKLQQAADIVIAPIRKAKFLCNCIHALSSGNRHEEAQASYDDGINILECLPKSERGDSWWSVWIDLHFALLDTLYFQGKSKEMQKICQKIVGAVDTYGTPHQRSEHLAFFERTHFIQNHYIATLKDVEDRRKALEWAQQTGEPNFIQQNKFGLGFTMLWAHQIPGAIKELETTLEQANEQGNIPSQNRCLTYLSIAYRLQDDEEQVRHTIKRLDPIAKTDGYSNYLGVVEANKAWLALQDKEIEDTKKYARSALNYWTSSPQNLYPMQWLAYFPLLSYAIERDLLSDAQSFASAMVEPRQQRLPETITTALEAAIQGNDAKTRALSHLQEACQIAKSLGYL